jgi:tetratricopeptide (TPR) repeat protein
LATTYNNVALVYKAKNDLAKAREYFEKAYTICLKKLGADHPNTKITKAAIDKMDDEEAEAVELPVKEKMAAMSFFGAAGMLYEALTDLKGKSEDELKRRQIKKIKEAQRLFKAADRDVLNKMYPGWGDYTHDSQFPLVTRILESTIENKPLAPTQKDLQGEIWWQKNYQGIILLMRKDPDIRPLFGPFPKK